MPINDSWIAATAAAIANGLPVASQDNDDRVPELQVIRV
jgi:predicted nucleic acid-binding protein